jgi:hypothetical protein
MGCMSTVIFFTFGFMSFAAGIILIQNTAHTLFMILVHRARTQDNFARISENLPAELYSLTDIGNMRQIRSELMLQLVIFRTAIASTADYIEGEPGRFQSKIFQYNFACTLLRYLRTINRQIDNLFGSFPFPPDFGDLDN